MQERNRNTELKPFKDSFKNDFAIINSMTVYRSGRQRCAPGFCRHNRIYNFYILHYVTKGKGTYAINGKTYRVCAGDAFLIYPGVSISKETDPEDLWEYCWVGFNGTDAQMLVNMTQFTPDNAVITYNQPEIAQKIENIHEHRGHQLCSSIRMTAMLYELFAYLIETGQNRHAGTHINDQYVSAACDYIGKSYSNKNLTVEMIAEYICISRSRLFRAFKDTLNKSPKIYLEETRIREACVLLQMTNFSISDVADKIGYADPLYFSKVFRRMVGKSPTDFRKEPEIPVQVKNTVFDIYTPPRASSPAREENCTEESRCQDDAEPVIC